MPNLLLQSCSASKQKVNHPTPAFDLYTGYFYKIINKSIRENEFRSDTDINILSAKYGLIAPDDEIEYYEQRMSSSRARELNPTVVQDITKLVKDNQYDRIVINMGSTYRKAIAGLDEYVDVALGEITGGGIGEKGSALYQFVRGDDSVVEVRNSV